MLERLQLQNFSNKRSLSVLRDLIAVFNKRRSTRHFSNQVMDRNIALRAIEVANTAPSGANKQPWTFMIVDDPVTKALIRKKSEEEEKLFYEERAPDSWLEDLKPLHTNFEKPFIEEASFLIPIFSKSYNLPEDELTRKNYYIKESVGIATGFLIASLHMAGLSTLTYTPSNRKFLAKLLGRPKNESTFMVVAAGLPTSDATAPIIHKKTLEQVLAIYENVKERTPHC